MRGGGDECCRGMSVLGDGCLGGWDFLIPNQWSVNNNNNNTERDLNHSIVSNTTVQFPAHFPDMLFAPWALAFDFSSDLDISAQGQAMIVLFIGMHFF